jgi:bacterioferritin
MKQPFSDLDVIRQRARSDLALGAVTGAYHADRARVVEALNEVLATALTISLACREYGFASHRSRVAELAGCFKHHAGKQDVMANRLGLRIVQLRGQPTLRPEELLARAHVVLPHTTQTDEMVRESLVAARTQIETLCAVARWLGDQDPTTRRLLEEALADAEALADDMDRLLAAVVAMEPRPVNPQQRVQRERERYHEAFDKPPWWDPQWIAARG